MASSSVVSRIASANAQANLRASNLGLNKALTRLSGGLRIDGNNASALGFTGEKSQGLRETNDADQPRLNAG